MDESDSSSEEYGMSYLDDDAGSGNDVPAEGGGGDVQGSGGESEPAESEGPPATYDSPYRVEGEGIPREYLEFQIRYLTALGRAWTLSMNITARDTATAKAQDVLRPGPIQFGMSMQVAVFSWKETKLLWNNYSGVSFNQRWGRGDYLAELRREVERLKEELKHSTNNERFTPSELMDRGAQRSWLDGSLISPPTPGKSEADHQIREDQKKIKEIEKALEAWFDNQQSAVPPGVDPVQAVEDALYPVDEPPPGVDPEEALDEVLYSWTAGEELYPVDEPQPGVEPEAALDEVLYPVDEPQPGVDPEQALDEVLSTTLDEILYPWTADEELYPSDELPQGADVEGELFTPLPHIDELPSEVDALQALWDAFPSMGSRATPPEISVAPAGPLPGQSSILDDDEPGNSGIDESPFSGDGSHGPEGSAEPPSSGSSGNEADAAIDEDSAAGAGTLIDHDSTSDIDSPNVDNDANYGVDYLDEGNEGGDYGVDYLDEGEDGEDYGMDYLYEGEEGEEGEMDYLDEEGVSDLSDDPVAEDAPDDAPAESGE